MTYIAEDKLLDSADDSNEEISDDEEDGPTYFRKEDFEVPKIKIDMKKKRGIKQVGNEIIAYINKIRKDFDKEVVSIDYIEKVEERIILSGICYKYFIKLIDGDNPETLQFIAKKTGVKTGKTAIQLVSMPEPISIFPNQFLDKIKKRKKEKEAEEAAAKLNNNL